MPSGSGAEPVRVVRLVDGFSGVPSFVPVTPELADALLRLDAAQARRDRTARRRERPMAVPGSDGEELAFDPVDPRSERLRNDPRRLEFVRPVGLGVRWDGPRRRRQPCPVCRSLPLGAIEYCLLCDRLGDEANRRVRIKSLGGR